MIVALPGLFSYHVYGILTDLKIQQYQAIRLELSANEGH